MCAYYSGNYASFLIRQCSNAVPVKLKKWYLAALWRLWRKVKYLEIKSWKKRSKKLLSEECIHFREWKLPLRCPVWKFCLWGICEGIFSDAQISVVRKEMSSDEKWKEGLGANSLGCVYSSHRVKASFLLNSLKSLFLWNLRKDIWKRS